MLAGFPLQSPSTLLALASYFDWDPSPCIIRVFGPWQPSGPRFNIKMPSYQYRKSHCGDKTVVRSSYLHNGISYTGKMASSYWIRALVDYWQWVGDMLTFCQAVWARGKADLAEWSRLQFLSFGSVNQWSNKLEIGCKSTILNFTHSVISLCA